MLEVHFNDVWYSPLYVDDDGFVLRKSWTGDMYNMLKEIGTNLHITHIEELEKCDIQSGRLSTINVSFMKAYRKLVGDSAPVEHPVDIY